MKADALNHYHMRCLPSQAALPPGVLSLRVCDKATWEQLDIVKRLECDFQGWATQDTVASACSLQDHLATLSRAQ